MNENKVKVGDLVTLSTKYAYLMGFIMEIAEFSTFAEASKKIYKLKISDGSVINLWENEITSMEPMIKMDKEGYFKSFEKKWDIKCFDKEGELLGSTYLLGAVLYSKENIWDKLSDEEKREFMKNASISDQDIIDLMDVHMKDKKEIDKHIERERKLFEKELNFLQRINELSAPSYLTKWALDFISYLQN